MQKYQFNSLIEFPDRKHRKAINDEITYLLSLTQSDENQMKSPTFQPRAISSIMKRSIGEETTPAIARQVAKSGECRETLPRLRSRSGRPQWLIEIVGVAGGGADRSNLLSTGLTMLVGSGNGGTILVRLIWGYPGAWRRIFHLNRQPPSCRVPGDVSVHIQSL